MKNIFKKILKYLFARMSVELASLWPSHLNTVVMGRLNEIQLSSEQLKNITATIKEKSPCKLLIFGLGNDSVFWHKINRNGVTIFLEDDNYWFNKITEKSKDLKTYLVNYNTRIFDWKTLLDNSSLLEMTLPDHVEKESWDIIIVDAPSGWNDQSAGRMKSIYLSSRLVKNSGDVFVHDCEREIEDAYCSKYLKKENLEAEIETPIGFLRHYRITNRAT